MSITYSSYPFPFLALEILKKIWWARKDRDKHFFGELWYEIEAACKCKKKKFLLLKVRSE